ncbi:hypothetical protein [Endozoicomonas sp. ALC066]|uniref:hypothetical protein n=1 Tax=Endozoicomonas sp. ALC066 TaxID=3403078 RepID=UPI003BB5814D
MYEFPSEVEIRKVLLTRREGVYSDIVVELEVDGVFESIFSGNLGNINKPHEILLPETPVVTPPAEGSSKISGKVTFEGAAAQLPVKAFKTDDSTFSAKVTSAADGTYSLDVPGVTSRVYVFSHQEYGTKFNPSTAVAVGDIIRPTEHNGFLYECTTGGTTAADEPTWPQALGASVTSGDAVFVTKRMYLPKIHGPVLVEGESVVIEVGSPSILKGMTERVWPTVFETPEVGNGTEKVSGGVLLPDGRVYNVPANYSRAAIYDPSTDAVAYTPAIGSGTGKFRGGVLLPDGRVYNVPHNYPNAVIYDPSTDTVTEIAVGSGVAKFMGAVLLSDGRIYNVPANHSNAVIYDPSTDTVTYTTAIGSGSYKFAGGLPLPDGRVYHVPHNYANAAIYDPSTNTVTETPEIGSGSGKFLGAVLLPDGRVYNVPHTNSTAAIYDPSTNTVTETPEVGSGTGKFVGGVLLPDGRVYHVPHNYANAAIYDPSTDTVTETPEIGSGTGKFVVGVLLPDGRVYNFPYNYAKAVLVSTGTYPEVPLEACLNPMFNKY